MKLLIRLVFVTLLFITVSCGSNGVKTEPAEPVIPVQATRVKKGDISLYIYTTGSIFPKQESVISPKIFGRIEKLYVDEGDRVKANQPLVKLEQDRLRILVEEAEASLQEARAQLKNIKTKVQRSKGLFEQGVVEVQQYDDLVTEGELAQAIVRRIRATVERAHKDLEDSVISAPFDGFIVEKMMNEGEMATSTPPSSIFHLIDTSSVKIECNITEEKKTVLCVGKESIIELDAYPGEIFTGNITMINPKVDIESRTFKIKIEIPNDDFRLESGMFVRIRIIDRESKGAFLIPQRVIIDEGGEKKVYVIQEGRAVEKTITTGIIDKTTVEVTDGLDENDIIVTEGLYAIKDGIKVLIKKMTVQGEL